MTYCRWEEADLADQLLIDCRLPEGEFWEYITIGLDGFVAPGAYQHVTPEYANSPTFDFGVFDTERPSEEWLYAARTGYLGGTLELSVFDLCLGQAKGTIDASWTADDGSVVPGELHIFFDVTF